MVHKVDITMSENEMTSGSVDITKLGMNKKLSTDLLRLIDSFIVIGSEELSRHIGNDRLQRLRSCRVVLE